MEIQIAPLLLAGAGIQGFTEWQIANMMNHTNKLVTDIFVAVMDYKCGLPQGNGFLVEIANLNAMLLLMWWNMVLNDILLFINKHIHMSSSST